MLDINGNIRTFKLVTPPDTTKKSFLIIALHGFSGNSKTVELISNQSQFAQIYNFFVAYPNGYSSDPKNLFYSWNAGFCCGKAQERNSDDVLFIKKLIEHISSKYSIDKILITGISNGAMMTNRLGIELKEELGDLLSGIIPIAGVIGKVKPKEFRFDISQFPIDVLIFHGMKDTFIPYNGDKGIKPDDPNQFLPVPEEVKYWVRVNRCNEEPVREVFAEGQVIKETYSSFVTNKKVIFYLLTEGTHTWPGGKKVLQLAGKPVSKEICDASQIIIDYFILGNR